jgi:hypothetical protein
LCDKADDKPWASKLPFPVHVVERVEHLDHVTRQRYVQHFAYHHGYFDGHEREFRGFGMVESWDTGSFEDFSSDAGLFHFEQFDAIEEKLHQPPVYTKTWIHNGRTSDDASRRGVRGGALARRPHGRCRTASCRVGFTVMIKRGRSRWRAGRARTICALDGSARRIHTRSARRRSRFSCGREAAPGTASI